MSKSRQNKPTMRRVERAMLAIKHPARPVDIKRWLSEWERTTVSTQSICNALARLVDDGRVVKLDRGLYEMKGCH